MGDFVALVIGVIIGTAIVAGITYLERTEMCKELATHFPEVTISRCE